MSRNKILEEMLRQQRNLDEKTLKLIATRLNSFRGLGLVDFFDFAYYGLMYDVMLEIEEAAYHTRKKQVADLEQVLNSSAKNAYNSMKYLYDDGQKVFLPFKNNTEVKDFVSNEVQANCNQFNETLKNVGYPVTDEKTGARIFHNLPETYQYIVNSAKMQATTNPFGYDLWTRKVMKKLMRDGLKIYNYNQDTHRYKQQNSYSYIRNFIKDAVYRVCQGVYNAVANQVGIDGVEVSVHLDCALDHLDIQGKQFSLHEFHKMQSNDDFYDIYGNHYIGLDRALGTWNCRHYVYPVILGKSKPRYTSEQLQEIKENRNMIYATVVDSSGEKAYIPFGDFDRYKGDLLDRLNNLTMDMRVAEKLNDPWLVNYYKTRILSCKSELNSIKIIRS